MAVPKFRVSSSKRDRRRSHHALKAKSPSYCSACQEPKYPNTVCGSCGHYKDGVVFEPKKQTGTNAEFA